MTRRSLLRIGVLILAVSGTASAVAGKARVVGLFNDKAIVEVDGKQLVLKAGGPAKRGVRLLSTDGEQAVLEVDGKPSTYRVGTQIGSNHKAVTAGSKIVQIAPDGSGMYFSGGTINGHAVNFLVDTGATMVAMNRHTAKRLGLNYRLDGTEGMTQTASGYAKAYYLTLKKVSVGDISMTDVDAAVIDGDQPSEVLLGNTFLSRIDMHRKGRLLLLQKN